METGKGRKKVRTQVVLLFLLLTLFTTFGSGKFTSSEDYNTLLSRYRKIQYRLTLGGFVRLCTLYG